MQLLVNCGFVVHGSYQLDDRQRNKLVKLLLPCNRTYNVVSTLPERTITYVHQTCQLIRSA